MLTYLLPLYGQFLYYMWPYMLVYIMAASIICALFWLIRRIVTWTPKED